MKKKLFLSNFLVSASFIFFLLITTTVYAQTPSFYNINTSTGGNTFPLGGATNRVQWLYAPNLFNSSGTTGTPSGNGTITKIYLRFSTANASTVYTDYTVSLGQTVGTTAAWSSTTWATGLTQCFYSASFQMTGVTAGGWYGITLQTPFAYDASKSLVFELKVSSTAGGNYVAQSTSQGRIWGTYSGTAGTNYGTGLVDFGIDLSKGSNDAGISAIQTPLCNPTLVATYTNSGINTIDSVKINWSVNGTMQTPQMRYNTPLGSGKAVNVTLAPDYNYIDGNTYNIKAWTSLPNNKKDTLNKNDTLKSTFQYQGPAGTPGVSDVIKCGPGQAPLVATPVNQGDSILWYNAATGGNVVAKGKNTLSPPLVLGTNTFYAQAFKMSAPAKLANPMTGTTYCTGSYMTSYVGSMFDVTPKNDIVVDSFAIDFYQFTLNSTYSVYYKTNTYVGSESNASAWTALIINSRANVKSVSGKNRGYLKIPSTSLAKGVVYGFYITTTLTTPNDMLASSGAATWSDAELSVSGGKYVYGTSLFATPLNNWYINQELYYKKQSCPSSRVAVQVTVKPSPNGAAFIRSTPFQTTQPNTNGTLGNPDIVANGDQLTYELVPPTGYTTANHGTDWKTFTPVVKTKSGTNIPMGSAWNFTPPSGTTPGKLTITPTAAAAITDQLLIVSMRIEDIKLYQCDSTILKHVFIAPRPVPDFKFGQPVCDGDNVIFTNASSVSSGNLVYKWDFATGNPADTATNTDVVFAFPTHGTYNVILTTTTVPYGYKETKIIPVVVTEIPKIGFKVLNACLGDSVSFINNTTISTGSVVYKWDFGNGTSSAKVNPKQKYPVAGGYKVTLIATSNGCSQTLTKNAQQFARPVAKFTTPPVLCDKTDIQFTNGSTIPIGNMGYTWSFGDGGISNFANPVHSYTTQGSKSVKMRVVSEFGCADSLTIPITLAKAPEANFTTGAVCNLSATSFNFTGSKPAGYLTTFKWDFAGESTSSQESPTKLFSIIGKKLITLTLTSNNGCTDILSREVDVKLQSKADFIAADVCEDEEAVFTNNSTITAGNLIFNWKFGDGKTSAAQSPRYLYDIDGTSRTFNVTLVAVVPGGCSDSITKQVTVNAKPNSDFSFTTSGRLVYFNAAQTGNTTYQWNFGDGGTAQNPSAQYHYLNSFASSKYNACLTVSNAAGCLTQTCKSVAITGGIDQLTRFSGVKIYPNPNKGNFTVTIEDPRSDISIAVYNLLGDVVKTIETNPLKSVYSIDLNVANGFYMLKVTNGGLNTTQRVTVNK